MPKVSDGVNVYNGLGTTLPVGTTLTGTVPTSNATANTSLYAWWNGKPHSDQYDWDVGAWYGAYASPGDASIATFLGKLFTVLQQGGVFYDKGTVAGNYNWRDCSVADTNMPNGIPLGAILAHGGRLLIQLPVRTAHDNAGQAFFNWLTHEVRQSGRCVSRTTATHALGHRDKPLAIAGGPRKFRIEENRGKKSGIRGAIKTKVFGEENHWGVNLALFGNGRTNWYSGNTASPNGAHGHLYIYFNAKDVGQCAGIMVGGENSGVGAMSQTFVGHGAKAVSEDFSPAGTYKWPRMNHGPNHMIEEFLVDLSDGWTWLQGLVAAFAGTQLDDTTQPVPAMRNTDALRLVIYAVLDLLADPPGNMGFLAKRRMEGHKTTLLNAHNLPRATLSAIMKECLEACGMQNVVISLNGGYAGSNVLTAPIPVGINSALATCQQHWAASV